MKSNEFDSGARTLAVFVIAFVSTFSILVFFNGQHLGANASLHWDASTCILTTDPMPDRATLEQSRRHIFDLARESGSADPTDITRYFLTPENRGKHAPLETVRRYYSQISYWLARCAFNLGADLTHSPTGAVIFFQLESALAIALGLSLLLTYAVIHSASGAGHAGRLFMVGLLFLTIATEPVVLSLARQMLTETAGFAVMVPPLFLFRAALAPTRRTASALGLIFLATGFSFLTIRARYTLGPAMIVLLPLVVLLSFPVAALLRRPGHFTAVIVTTLLVFGSLVAIDIHQYGPFILPWVYDDALVRSTRLYFHTDPPYEPFWVMLYVNLPLLLIPLLGAASWLISPEKAVTVSNAIPRWQRRLSALYAAGALLILLVPIFLMARQQVSFQPRHMFAFSAVFICVLMLSLPHVRWRPLTAIPIASLCLIVLIANIYSITGPQRTTMAIPWPKTIAGILRDRSQPGPHRALIHDLADGYFDWSDNSRVHDYLIVFRYLQHDEPGTASSRKSVLIIDSSVTGAGTYGVLVTRFQQPFIWWNSAAKSHATELGRIQSAVSTGSAVYLVTNQAGPNPVFDGLQLRPTGAMLNTAALFRASTFNTFRNNSGGGYGRFRAE